MVVGRRKGLLRVRYTVRLRGCSCMQKRELLNDCLLPRRAPTRYLIAFVRKGVCEIDATTRV
jgi:hypothetical protein